MYDFLPVLIFSFFFQKISEKHTPNNEYANFVTTHIEATVKCIPKNLRVKCRVLWEARAISEKRDYMNIALKIKETRNIPMSRNLKNP